MNFLQTSGYKKIYRGFLLEVSNMVLLALLSIISAFLSFLKTAQIQSYLISIANVIPILTIVIMMNGILEIQSESKELEHTKNWLIARLIVTSFVWATNSIFIYITSRLLIRSDFQEYVVWIFLGIATIAEDIIFFFNSYHSMMKAFLDISNKYGFGEEMEKRIKDADRLLLISNIILGISFFGLGLFLIGEITESSYRLPTPIVENALVVVFLVIVLSYILRFIALVKMTRISKCMAKDIEEISP